jgi:hypothetical protein
VPAPSESDPSGIRSVRALAHPLRLELLDLLRFEGPSTATLLARRVHESSGATSYHLRQLARFGFVEEVPSDGGLQRWWRHRERPVCTRIGEVDQGDARRLVAELLSREAHALDRFLSQRCDSDWDDAAFFQSRALRLTPGELDDLRLEIERLLAPLRLANAENPPAQALPVRVLAFGFPLGFGS